MRVSKMTVYRLVHSGELPAVRVGRSFRVPGERRQRVPAQELLPDRLRARAPVDVRNHDSHPPSRRMAVYVAGRRTPGLVAAGACAVYQVMQENWRFPWGTSHGKRQFLGITW